MRIEIPDEAVRHYCRLQLPELNNTVSVDILDHGIKSIMGEPCEECNQFKKAIKDAILREAGKRIPHATPRTGEE